MTSRLKRKLGDLGVDTSSAKANESFCLIGTPLPPLEKSKDTGEFVPLWKQEVRDEKGRRRLHGAFTGGFSAGYFNTVGSKEGWTPSTFVSSRSDRAKQKKARPEDFMDEEDLAELAENRKLVDTTEEMDLTGGTSAERGRQVDDESDSMAQKLEQALLPPPKDSVGARILKKMGWRMGQGIGPRLTYRQRKLQDALHATGSGLGEDEDEAEASKHTYAPRDTPLLLPQRKDNTHGLGYSPGMGLHESVTGRKMGAEGSGPRISAGFGLGALNDADDDDVDVYDSVNQRGRTRMAYDINDRDDNQDILIGARHTGAAGNSNNRSTQRSPSGATFRDGRPVLNGFVVDNKPVAEDQWFALPEIPKGWKPDPRRIWDKENAKPPPPQSSQPQSHRDWKTGISADQRGSLLGETPLPAAPRSVFDYLSEKDRERIQRATQSLQTGAPGEPTTVPSTVPEVPHIPVTPINAARAALQGFQPYASDPSKHVRYQTYLRSQADPSAPAIAPLSGQSVSAFNKEVADYAASAAVFKPMSAAMAGRFTSAAIVEVKPDVVGGLYTPSFEEEEKPKEEDKAKEVQREEDPKAHAAGMGMYGPMTRNVERWTPSRLLCKRFGVKDPHPEPGEDDAPAAPAAPGAAPPFRAPPIEDALNTESGDTSSGAEPLAIGGGEGWDAAPDPKGSRDLANIGLGEDEWQARDVLTYQRPKMDVFKAIFASDDEDSDDEGGGNADADEGANEPPPTETSSAVAGTITTIVKTEGKLTSEPTRLPAEASTSASYAPSAPAASASEKVDLASFRPTFVKRSDRETKNGAESSSSTKTKKRKEKTLVSFDDDGGMDIGLGAPRPKKRKDKEKQKETGRDKKRKKKDQEDDEDIWVEKEVPDAVKEMERMSVDGQGHSAPQYAESIDAQPGDRHASKGRKRAVDFM